MGVTTREKGVLKLVHPGRYVEIHTEPITAAEVMRRNPRHSVTQPDVFECPWIVVKPEADLVPGKVFFIVPNHKIYKLLKAKGHCSQRSSSSQMQSPKNHVNQHHIQTSQITTYAGVTPMHLSHNPTHRHQFKNMNFNDLLKSWEHERDKNHKKHSQVEYQSQAIAEYKRTRQIIMQKPQEDPTTELGFPHAYQKPYGSKSISTKLPKTKDPTLESECSTSKQVTVLKSCLRKPDSYRKFLNLRVTFDLPINNEERQRRAPVSPTEFADFLNW
jgi:hypothetical protein